MPRRLTALAVALAGVLVLVPAALAARVTVRIEGKTQTLFAPVPRVVQARTALEALEAASVAGELYYRVQSTSFGSYVDQIGRFPAGGTSGWVFKVDWATPQVGADSVRLEDGDTVLWYWADFAGAPAGPTTLRLERLRRRNCYRAAALDGNARPVAARGVTLTVDRRRVRARGSTQGAVACVGRHRGLVRATSPTAIRSNAVQ